MNDPQKPTDDTKEENPGEPWTIEADLMTSMKPKSGESIIDLVIIRYLMAGDTSPLAWWLLEDHKPSDAVLKVLGHMLLSEGPDHNRFPYQLQATPRSPKVGRPSKGPETKLRDLLIYLNIQKRMDDLGPGSYDAAIAEISDWVGVSSAVAKKAYDKYKQLVPPPNPD